MQITKFPGCCAGFVLHDFGHTACTEGRREDYDLDDVEAQLKACIEEQKHRAFLMITLNTEQREVYKTLLYKYGFRRKGSGYNRPHQSTVYVYIRFNQLE